MRALLTLLLLAFISPAIALPSLTIDLSTGKVLQHNQAFDAWHPASLTKLMTAYATFQAVASGKVNLDTPVVMTREARSAPPSKIGYAPGVTMRLEDALKLVVIKSANDVSVALAQTVGGSVDGFAAMMNAQAARLGMTGSRFVNPHGLHDPRQVVTARDMAVLLMAIDREFPQYSNLFKAPSVLAPQFLKSGKTRQKVHFTFNLLLERYRGANGFKTGFVCASGYNFAGAATRSGRRVAAIVFGRDGQVSRAVDAAKLMTAGFEQPVGTGVALRDLKPGGTVATRPRNMRPVVCTAEARAKRYNPAAGQAVIESPWLQKRQITRQPLVVTLLPRSAVPPKLRRIPTPTFRPDRTAEITPAAPARVAVAVGRTDIEALLRKQAREIAAAKPVGSLASLTRIPAPTFRPSRP